MFVGLLSLALLAACALLAVYSLAPPAAVPAGAPTADFSSGRALKHLEVIAQRPHPAGTREHEAVRAYITGELSRAGLNPEVAGTAFVSNIVARLKGQGGGKAVMLAAHYDTVPASPGAGDDGSAVAALLETARALREGGPLRNDVIFLFTDAEETGLNGAKAFVYTHPWAKDVGVVLNFEARGTRGPSLMFETSGASGWLVRHFAAAAPHPRASSLSDEMYKLLPNDTDLSIFKEAGFAGLNFAFIGGAENYHTPQDSLASLDERSLQHQGTYALALARRFGGADLDEPRGGAAVYFDLFGATVLSYPEGWVMPLALLAVVCFCGAAALGLRGGVLTFGGVAKGFAAALLVGMAALVLTSVVWAATGSLSKGARGDWYTLALALVAAGTAGALYVWCAGRVRVAELLAGGLAWWALLTLLTGWLLPGGSYLFVWPVLFYVPALALALAGKGGGASASRVPAWLTLGALPAVVLMAPLAYLSVVALTPGSFASVLVLVLPLFLIVILTLPSLQLLSAQGTAAAFPVPRRGAARGPQPTRRS